MGLKISPASWESDIKGVLDYLQSRRYRESNMYDLLLFTPDKISHRNKLEDLLKASLKIGLKTSPKKCQLFKKVDSSFSNRTLVVTVDKLSSSQLLDFIRSEGKGDLLCYLLVLRCSTCML